MMKRLDLEGAMILYPFLLLDWVVVTVLLGRNVLSGLSSSYYVKVSSTVVIFISYGFTLPLFSIIELTLVTANFFL